MRRRAHEAPTGPPTSGEETRRQRVMASRLNLARPDSGLTHIWNVSQRVGGTFSCTNLPTDVELVKVLIKKALEGSGLSDIAKRVPPAIVVNSSFEAIVGYWIFRF